MKRYAFLMLLFCAPLITQDAGLQKHIVRTFDNGQPYVVVYTTTGPDQERVKEELYYENGQLDYVGHYENGVEHGSWIYYWPNGNRKSEEYYTRGVEHGTMYDYDEDGNPIKEYKYMKGILLKSTNLSTQK